MYVCEMRFYVMLLMFFATFFTDFIDKTFKKCAFNLVSIAQACELIHQLKNTHTHTQK